MSKKMKILPIISLFCILLTMQNCGEYASMQDESFVGVLEGLGTPIDGNDKKQRVPFQMLSKKQILSSMVTSAGVTEADTALVSANTKLSSILSEKSELVEYNPPRAMTYANLSGETCRQLIAQEKSEKSKRLIRYGLPVKYSDISRQEVNETIRSFARSFWSRNETKQEYEIIIESLDDYSREIASLNENQKSERQTLFLCTAMMASLDAITY